MYSLNIYLPFSFLHRFLLSQRLLLATKMDTDTHEDTTVVHEVARDVDNDDEDDEHSYDDSNYGTGSKSFSSGHM